MATGSTKLKSILKQPTYPATSTAKEARDRETALYHANLIEQRKNIEYEILLSTETLIDFPRASAPYNASNPSLSDTKEFKSMLRPFQPSDYDALIEERNINEHCGYALCPKPRMKEDGGGKYRILGMRGKAKDFRVVEKEELEKWCSDACARRALYVKVQLSERPAWERERSSVSIDLLDEPMSDENTALVGLENLHLESQEATRQRAENLALERGDRSYTNRNGLVDVTILEKDVQRPIEAPSSDAMDLSGQLEDMHLELEGYTPSFQIGHDGRTNESMN